MIRSKRYQESLAKIDRQKTYSASEAIKLLKEIKNPKFDSTLEAHLNLGIDASKSDQHVKGTVSFPHQTGKKKRIAAFVTPEKEKEAREAGVQVVGGEELVREISRTKKMAFDIAIAEPAMMKVLAPIAKILGPKGLMPNPKTETVGENIGEIIKDLAQGKTNFKMDATGNIHQALGKISASEENLLENYNIFLSAVQKAKPESAKGTYIKSITLTTTMSPGVKVKV